MQAAGQYGLHRTTKALRLDYYTLKKRVEDAATDREPDREAAATFLELPAPVSGGASECIVELEDPGGAKMRLHPDHAADAHSGRGGAGRLPQGD